MSNLKVSKKPEGDSVLTRTKSRKLKKEAGIGRILEFDPARSDKVKNVAFLLFTMVGKTLRFCLTKETRGFYGTIGGHVESFDKRPFGAAKREFREEVGTHLPRISILYTIDYIHANGDITRFYVGRYDEYIKFDIKNVKKDRHGNIEVSGLYFMRISEVEKRILKPDTSRMPIRECARKS